MRAMEQYSNNINNYKSVYGAYEYSKDYIENKFYLTRREIEVLFFLVEGLSNVEISKEIKISAHTVKDHVINIFNKFGVNNRTQASVQAVRYNII